MSASSPSGAEAAAAGLRPCLRCKPDEVGRDAAALDKALALLAAAEEAPSLETIAAAVGYSPHHFHRIFRRATGVTPAAYARSLRARRTEAALDENEPDHRRDLRCRLFGPRRASTPMPARPARHDAFGLARRRPRRDDPLGDRRDRSRHDAGRRDRQGHLPALLRRGRGGACAAASPTRRSSPAAATMATLVRPHRRRGRTRPSGRTTCRSTCAAPPSRRRCGASCAHPRRRDPHLCRRSPPRSAGPTRCAPRARPAAPTMSPCSSPATASSAPTAAPAAMPMAWSARRRLLERERRGA